MKKRKKAGFSLIEVLVGLFLVAVAVLGLAHLFLLAVTNNRNADRISTATNLAHQQIERLRSLTSEELMAEFQNTVIDELIDINLDGTNNFRRITYVEETPGLAFVFRARVYVYSAEKIGIEDPLTLIGDPEDAFDNTGPHRPRAFMSTIITR